MGYCIYCQQRTNEKYDCIKCGQEYFCCNSCSTDMKKIISCRICLENKASQQKLSQVNISPPFPHSSPIGVFNKFKKSPKKNPFSLYLLNMRRYPLEVLELKFKGNVLEPGLYNYILGKNNHDKKCTKWKIIGSGHNATVKCPDSLQNLFVKKKVVISSSDCIKSFANEVFFWWHFNFREKLDNILICHSSKDNSLHCFLPYFPGILLEEEINKTYKMSPIPESKFLELFCDLKRMHKCKFVHNDINTENIIFNPRDGSLRFIDFGFASFYSKLKKADLSGGRGASYNLMSILEDESIISKILRYDKTRKKLFLMFIARIRNETSALPELTFEFWKKDIFKFIDYYAFFLVYIQYYKLKPEKLDPIINCSSIPNYSLYRCLRNFCDAVDKLIGFKKDLMLLLPNNNFNDFFNCMLFKPEDFDAIKRNPSDQPIAKLHEYIKRLQYTISSEIYGPTPPIL